MAKGTSRRGNADTNSQSLTSLLALPVKPMPTVSPTLSLLHAMEDQRAHQQELAVLRSEDRREYTPDRSTRGPGALIRRATQLHIGRIGRSLSKGRQPTLPATVKFRVPNYVSICVRRKIRREVYLAVTHNKKRGSGASRRRNLWSSVKC